MSMDIVDDLENAESHIGELRAALRWLVDNLEGWDVVRGDEYTSGTYLCEKARALLADPYERPTCDEDCDNEVCGSPRHDNQEFNDNTGRWEDA